MAELVEGAVRMRVNDVLTPAEVAQGWILTCQSEATTPTLSVVYYPLDSKSAFQPYVGGGINYTWIYDEHVGSEASANGFSNFKAKNSWGLAWQVGADYMITDNIMLNAQVRYIDIDTRATVENNAVAPGTRARVNVDVDPFIYMVGLGYKF